MSGRRGRGLRALALAGSLAWAIPRGAPAAPPAESARELARRYGNARPNRFFDVTSDGARVLLGSRFGETQQAHLALSPLGARAQLTFESAAIDAARFFPQDPNRLLYLAGPDADGQDQLYEFDRQSAEATRLSDGTGTIRDLVLARDGRRFAWASDAGAALESDVYVAEAGSPEAPRRLSAERGRWRPLDFAPTARALLVARERSAGDAELFSAPVDGSALQKLWPPAGAGSASVRFACYAADGHGLFVVTDLFSEADELVLLDADHPERPARRLTQALPWSVDALAAAQDRGAPAAAAIAVNQGGYDRLYLLEPGTFKLLPVALPAGVVTALRFPAVKSDVLFLGLTSPREPEDIFQLDVRTRRLVRWTRAEPGPLDERSLLEPARASWLSDGVEIPALVYRPRARDGAAERLPVVLALGRETGARSLSRPGFDAMAQLLAGALGAAVVSPGLRGTSGAGKKLLGDGDPARLREEQLRDLAAGLDWIAAQPDLDKDRVVLLTDSLELARGVEANLGKRLRAALGADARAPGGSKSADALLASLLGQLREKLQGAARAPARATAQP